MMNTGIDRERMNAFAQLTMLRNAIKNVASDDQELDVIDEMLNRLNSRAYTVAVVGEFNRGKSSLINALLGMSVLPADITPTTATINRVVYSDTPNVRLKMKSGNVEEIPISMLKGRVTKLTESAESAAEQIDEAVIGYPTVFCRNNISILDTPGMNESAEMDDLTFSRMNKADALIFMIHALIPFSTSEAQAVCRLLEYPNIKHVLFTVGFIDKVPEADRERMITLIQKRIIKQTSAIIDADVELDQEEIKRRKTIIEKAVVLGVSAKMALDAFVNGSMEELKASGIEDYKKLLMARLTAQQDAWVTGEIRPYLEKASVTFAAAAQRSIDQLEERIREGTEKMNDAGASITKLQTEVVKEASLAKTGAMQAAGTLGACAQKLKSILQDKVDLEMSQEENDTTSLVDAFNTGAVEGVFGWVKKKVKDLGVYREKDDPGVRGIEIGFAAAKLEVTEGMFSAVNEVWKKKYAAVRDILLKGEAQINERLLKAQEILEIENAQLVNKMKGTSAGGQDELLKNIHAQEIQALQAGNITIGTVNSAVQRLSDMLAQKLFNICRNRAEEAILPLISLADGIRKEGEKILNSIRKELNALATERDELKVQIESMKSFLQTSEEDEDEATPPDDENTIEPQTENETRIEQPG